MLDGFQYVFVQIGLVVAVTALLAGVLGWLIGRGSGRQRPEKAAAPSALARPVVVEEPAPDAGVAEVAPPHAASEPAAEQQIAYVPQIAYLPQHAIEDPTQTEDPDQTEDIDPNEDPDPSEDPGRTEIRMSPTSGRPATTAYLPRTAVAMYSAPAASPASAVDAASVWVVTLGEVQFLRQELRQRDLEIGRIEAAALSAWDRTVPQLEQEIEDLMAERQILHRGLREARERSDADVLSIDRLRTLVAGRDTKIAELRAQS